MEMKIYLDVLFFINFFFDFLLLFIVSLLLKRNIPFRRLLLGGFLGAISIFLLFLKMNSIFLFFFKFLFSLIMVLATFSFKNISYTIKNIGYLYLVSIFLGGALYVINIQFSYQHEGIVFYHNGLSPNLIVMMILSPFILVSYLHQNIRLKKYQFHYKVDVYLKNHKHLRLNGFLDSGNQLYDPYLHRPIIIVKENILKKQDIEEYILVEANTILKKSLIKCIEVEKIKIDGLGEYREVLLGILNRSLNMEGIDCILHYQLGEGIL